MTTRSQSRTRRAASRMTALAMALSALMGAALPLAPVSAVAQAGSPFRTVVQVNDGVVTRFEVDQRLKFLQLLRQPGVTEARVIEDLIDDRLKLDAARATGNAMTEDQIQQGMEEFAGRANLTAEEFIRAIGAVGIDAETFRAFVLAGASWRSLVQRRFGGQARIAESELDRAMALAETGGAVEVLLSEIVLPLTPDTAAETRARAESLQETKSIAAFAEAARQYSVSPSAPRGGELPWMPLSKLPPSVAPLFLTLAPGDVTPPVPLGGAEAIALFQLRALKDGRPALGRNAELHYMLVRTAPGQAAAEIARVKPLIDDCDELYPLYPAAAADQLQSVTAERNATAGTTAAVIDRLDPGEIAALPGNSAYVMLCKRTPVLGADLSRDEVRQRLSNRKLEQLAAGYLADLRARAYISRP